MNEQQEKQQEIIDEQLSETPQDEKEKSEAPVAGEESPAAAESTAEESTDDGPAGEEGVPAAPDGTEEEAVPTEDASPLPATDQAAPPEKPAEAPAGPCAKIFNALSYAGLPLLILLSAAISFWCVWHPRDLWFSDEVTIADAFMNLKAGDWLALVMNGLPYPNKPPLYFWFMEVLDWIPAVSTAAAMFLASAVSHALFIVSVWCLARATGHDRRIAFAAGLITLGCLCIDGLAGYVRMDLLFAAAITFSMTCLYRGACKAAAPLWLLAGFLLLAVSVLVKGPFGIALALGTSILFLCWIGKPSRLNSRDGIPGFLLLLLTVSFWLAALYLTGHSEYVHSMLGTQFIGRILNGGAHSEPWWFYAALLPLIWIPWTLLPLFVNWKDSLRSLPGAWKNRREATGSSWLWIWLVCGFAILSATPAKLAVYILPLTPPLAVLCGRALLHLSPNRSRCFYALCTVLLSLAGLALILADVFPMLREFVPAGMLPALPETVETWISSLEGTLFMGSILILASILLILFVRLARPDGALLVMAMGIAAAAIPYNAITAPSLCPVLSPKSQAAVMEEMSRSGYSVAAYQVYPGAYAWHLNAAAGTKAGEKRLACTDLATEEELTKWLAAHPKTVAAMPLESWNAWKDKPVNSSVIGKSSMAGMACVVAAINAGNETEKPAAPSSGQQSAPADVKANVPVPAQGANDTAEQAIREIKESVKEAPAAPVSAQ